MPNFENITSPITLVAYGRSGTTVLSRAFASHPQVDVTGETANLIFTPWRAFDQIKGLTRFNDDLAAAAATESVRSIFLRVFPSEKRYWMQKPIGMPRVFWEFGVGSVDKFADWYWETFNACFPDSRTFSIIRHPYDVSISAREYWKFSDDGIWQSQTIMLKLLMHPKAGIRKILQFEEVSVDPEPHLKELSAALGIPFDPRMTTAYHKLFVPSPNRIVGNDTERQQKQQKRFRRIDEWSKIIKNANSEATLQAYNEVLDAFGMVEAKLPETTD